MFGRKKSTALEFPKFTAERLNHYRHAPTGAVDFIQEQTVARNAFDGGRSWIRPTLTGLQKQVVTDVLSTRDNAGDPFYTTMLLSWARKMAKTWLASAMWTYKASCFPNELILLSGPTRDSARELSFTSIVDTFTHNKPLAKAVGAEILKGVIKIKATGSEIRAVSRTLGAQAGADWTVCHVDELWAFQGKQMTEFFRTLTTPSPARKSPLLGVTSYAPIRGRSILLEQLLARAKRKEPRFYASIVSGADAVVAACPWITRKFLSQMKRSQPAKVFRRVFLNKTVADMDEQDRYLFSSGQIEACIDLNWQRQHRKPEHARGPVVVGVDFAPKSDCAAIAALVRMKDDTIALLDLQAKHGSRKSPLPSAWVFDAILDFVARFGMVKIMCDPTGIVEEVVKLRARGFEVVEISHQGAKLADALYRAIAGRRVRLFKDAGVVTLADERSYSLQDELRHLLHDTETQKIGHTGEGNQPGRHFDDRCTAIGLALMAPELDVAGAASLQFDVTQWLQPITGNVAMGIPGIGQPRIFAPGGVGTRECLAGIGASSLPRFGRQWLSPGGGPSVPYFELQDDDYFRRPNNKP